MKKIFTTLFAIFVLTIIGKSQTYKKITVNNDTLLQVIETKTTTDTLSRKDLKAEIERFKQAKKSGLESIEIQQKLNAFYQEEIDRLRLLLKKTY